MRATKLPLLPLPYPTVIAIGGRHWPSAAMVVLSIGFWWLNRETTSPGLDHIDTEAIAMQYFEMLPNTVAPNTRGLSTADSLQVALYYYEQGSLLPLVETIFSDLRDRDSLPDNLLIYLAVTQIANDNTTAAIETLTPLQTDPIAQWYYALALLRDETPEQVEAAVTLLTAISADGSHPYQALAKEMLDALK